MATVSDQVDLGTMSIDHTEHCGNSDIIALVALLDLGLTQLSRCPSATRNDCQPQDVAIIVAWTARFKEEFEVFSGKPELYLPNAAPKPKLMPAPPVIKIVQNPSIQHQMYEMSQLRTQLLFSEDRERTTGFHPTAAAAVVAPWIEKFTLYNELMAERLGKPEQSWQPDANLQDPGVNVGHPR